MPEATVSTTSPMSNSSLMDRAESAIGELPDGDAPDLAAEGKAGAHTQELPDNFFELDEEKDPAAPVVADADAEAEGEESETLEGSRDAPYTVKTLPDAYVTLKVDGEEQTISVREMTDGYMRESAFHKRMNQTHELAERAKKMADDFKGAGDRLRNSFTELINDPEELYSFLDENREEVLDKLARKRLALMMEWQKDPAKRLEHERVKHARIMEKQRRKLDDEQKTYKRTREEEESQRKYVAMFESGYRDGMKKAGYPKVTDEFRYTVNGLLTARKTQSGQELTSKDVEDAIVRAAKIVGTETVTERKPAPPPAPAPGQRKPAPKAKSNSQPQKFSQLFRTLDKRY